MFRGSNYSIQTDKDPLNKSQLFEQQININMLGVSDVGKSSMLACIDNQPYKQDIKSTTSFAIRFKRLRISSYLVLLYIWDADGDRMLEYIEQGMFDRCDGVIQVFEIGDKQSFHELQNLHYVLQKRLKNKPVQMILAGNKTDIKPQSKQLEQAEKQCNFLADKFAKRQGILYLRTSAKLNSSVKDCFVQLIKQILIKRATSGGASGRGARALLEDEVRVDDDLDRSRRGKNNDGEVDKIDGKVKTENSSYNIGCNCCKAVRSCNLCQIF